MDKHTFHMYRINLDCFIQSLHKRCGGEGLALVQSVLNLLFLFQDGVFHRSIGVDCDTYMISARLASTLRSLGDCP